MSSNTVAQLRRTLEERFPGAQPVRRRATAVGVATGVGPLDRALPGAGLPRGRLAVWDGVGAAAVLRAACRSAVARGERAAWIDGAGVVAGATWLPGPLLVRPGKNGAQALVCAEELLRSGGFALVVLAGAGRALGAEAVRLSRAAGESGAAFVALADEVPVAALRLSSRLAPDGYRWRPGPGGGPAAVEAVRVAVEVRSMGSCSTVEFWMKVAQHEVRLCAEPGLADRRGAGR